VQHSFLKKLKVFPRAALAKYGVSFAFVGTVILINLFPSSIFLACCTLFWILLGWRSSEFRSIAWTAAAFVLGFLVYFSTVEPLTVWLTLLGFSREFVLIGSRGLLVFYLAFLFLAAALSGEKKPILYWRIGDFRERIAFPWIWRGFDHPPIWFFISIFSIVTSLIFVCIRIFVIEIPFDWKLLGLAVGFALVNSVLEEIMWRGLILSRFVQGMGQVHALIVTSLAFGFYHYGLGISLLTCLGFAVGSIFMAGLTLRSKGLMPVIIFHFVLNFWMVMGGMVGMER